MGEKVGQIAKVPEVKQSNSNSRVRRTERLQSMDTPVDRILFLQRTAGNQAVSRLMRSGALQAKLRIGQPGDVYEQEADRVADAVMQMPEPRVQRQIEPEEEETLQTKPLAEQITPLIQRELEPEREEEAIQTKPIAEGIRPLIQRQTEPVEEEEEAEPEEESSTAPESEESTPVLESVSTRDADELGEEEESLQTKSLANKPAPVTAGLQSRIQPLKGNGQPLPGTERTFFEPRFGANFSHVRIRNNPTAANVARSINARAFTRGHDVVFGKGEYTPGTSTGRRLLAHELTHVVLQRKATRPFIGMMRTLPGDGRGTFIQRTVSHSMHVRSVVNPADPINFLKPGSSKLEEVHFFVNGKDFNKISHKVAKQNLFPLPNVGRKIYRAIPPGALCIVTGKHRLKIATQSFLDIARKPPWRKLVSRAYIRKLFPGLSKRCRGRGSVILHFKGIPSDAALRSATWKAATDHAIDDQCLVKRHLVAYENAVKRLPTLGIRAGYLGLGSCRKRVAARLKRQKRYNKFVGEKGDFALDYDVVDRVKRGLPARHVFGSSVTANTGCSRVTVEITFKPWRRIRRNCSSYIP